MLIASYVPGRARVGVNTIRRRRGIGICKFVTKRGLRRVAQGHESYLLIVLEARGDRAAAMHTVWWVPPSAMAWTSRPIYAAVCECPQAPINRFDEWLLRSVATQSGVSTAE